MKMSIFGVKWRGADDFLVTKTVFVQYDTREQRFQCADLSVILLYCDSIEASFYV